MKPDSVGLNLPHSYSLNTILDFLKSKGWIVSSKSVHEALLISPEDGASKNTKYLIGDYDREEFRYLTIRLFKIIAGIEKCEVSEVFEDFSRFNLHLISAYQGVIKLKFGTEAQEHLKLIEVEQAVYHARMALAHSIQSEMSGPLPYKKKPNPSANEFSHKFEFEHTQKGSYIMVIRAPKAAVQPSLLDPEQIDSSLQNKSIARLAKGFDQIFGKRADLSNINDLFSIAEKGINANMATHVLQLFSEVSYPKSAIVFNVRAELKNEYQINQLSFNLGYPEIELLSDFAKKLSEPQVVELDIPVRVIKMASKDPQQEDLFHKVTLKSLTKDGLVKSKVFSVNLNKKQYKLAADKHLNSKPLMLKAMVKVLPGSISISEVLNIF